MGSTYGKKLVMSLPSLSPRRGLCIKSFLFSLIFLIPQISTAQDPLVAWITRYNGPGNGNDGGNAIEIDSEGNSYVTGYSRGDSTHLDIYTAKYDLNGQLVWDNIYDGPSHSLDEGMDLALDEAGNVFITGTSCIAPDDWVVTTIKYSNDGEILWISEYNGDSLGYDIGHALQLDPEGNVYVTGNTYDSSVNIVTIKYDANGVEEWVQCYNGPGNHQDFGYALDLDLDGNVFVAGVSTGLLTSRDYAVIKYDNLGSVLWVRTYTSVGHYSDQANAISVHSDGSAYVTGVADTDYGTIRYSPDGEELWVSLYNGFGNGFDLARDLAVDEAGNVFVTGRAYALNGWWDIATIKYNALGTAEWFNWYNGPVDKSDDSGVAIEVGESGTVYVIGRSSGDHTWDDFVTIAYDDTGDTQWFMRYDGPESHYDYITDLALDSNENVFVTGRSYGYEDGFDCVTIKYEQVSGGVAESQVKIPSSYVLLSPNPCYGQVTVNYNTPNDSALSMSIYSIAGRLVEYMVIEKDFSGILMLNMDESPSGIYFCLLELESGIISKQFTHIRDSR